MVRAAVVFLFLGFLVRFFVGVVFCFIFYPFFLFVVFEAALGSAFVV